MSLPSLNLEPESIGDAREALAKIKTDMEQLKSLAGSTEETVRKVGAAVRTETSSMGRGGGGGGGGGGEEGHGGGGHGFGLHQLHALHSLMSGNVNRRVIMQGLGALRGMGGAAAEFAGAVAPVVLPVAMGLMAVREIRNNMAEGLKRQEEAGKEQITMYTKAFDLQYKADQAGTGEDFFKIRRDAEAAGRWRAVGAMGFMEKAFTFTKTMNIMGDEAGAKYADRVMDRLMRAKKLWGGNIAELAQRFDPHKFLDDSMVKKAVAMREHGRSALDSFIAKNTSSGRSQEFTNRMNDADTAVDRTIAAEEQKREKRKLEFESNDPSWRAIQKQTMAYLRVVEENVHLERMEWAPN